MAQFGLLGEKLSHSFSPQLHRMLGDYRYDLFEVAPEHVAQFMRAGAWDGLNVTIPYKKTVFRYLDEVSAEAAEAGCVNTVVRRDGRLFGDNTDIYGFRKMVQLSGIPVEGRKTLVLGSGGASSAVCIALKSLGCTPVVISRSGPDHYGNLEKHSDAQVIVNTTPVGMYPGNGASPLDLAQFPRCCGVLDVVYNPFRTELLLQAERLQIPHMNGLYMLAAQAKRSAEVFTGRTIDDSEIDRIYRVLAGTMENIVLIGMPGCGKSFAARELGRRTGRPVLDTDAIITEKYGITPAGMIVRDGEAAFREAEHSVILEVGKSSGAIIAAGGGVVTRRENYEPLHQNGRIVWLQRSLAALSTEDRPLSVSRTPEVLYQEREPQYRAFADAAVNMDSGNGIEQLLRLTGGAVMG